MNGSSGSGPRDDGPSTDPLRIRHVLEACLLVAGRAMGVVELQALFADDADADTRPPRADILAALAALQRDYEGRGIELVEVASGWRLQSRSAMEPWVARLLRERPPRYSRALLETLVLVAYRQPITRGEIEEVRGVAVSSGIIRTLQEREWVREIGHKEVPGRPALLGTTRQFLDYFNLKRLEDLPPLGELEEPGPPDPAPDPAPGEVPDGVSGNISDDIPADRPGDVGDVGGIAGGPAANDAGDAGEVAGPEADRALSEQLDDGSSDDRSDDEPDDEPGEPGEPGPAVEQAYEDPRERLRRVVDRFAAEHREDLQDRERSRDAPAPPDGVTAAPAAGHGPAAGAPRRDDDVP